MYKAIDAKYFFGIHPKAIPAKVHLLEDRFLIQYESADGILERIWEIDKIVSENEGKKHSFILKYGTKHPYEYIEFTEAGIPEILEEIYPKKKWLNQHSYIMKNPLSVVAFISLLFILLCVAAYFWLMPKTADVVAKMVPVSWEVELGSKISGNMIDKAKEDELMSLRLDSFYNLLKIKSSYPVQLHYLKDSTVNAFAIPGGNIVIYKGLFDKINSYEALAGLIGHEQTHIEYKHSLKTILRTMTSYILLAAIFGDLTGLAGIILENANSLVNLSYSREFEMEADHRAVDLLLERKIPLEGMGDLFRIFLDQKKPGVEVPKFLNTHPITQDRIDYIEKRKDLNASGPENMEDLRMLFNRMKLN